MLSGEASKEKYEKMVKELGGKVITEIKDPFDVLIITNLKRTTKILQAVNLRA